LATKADLCGTSPVNRRVILNIKQTPASQAAISLLHRLMNQAELICTLLIVVAALAILAKKVALPYPVLLVIAGLTLGFVPGLPAVQLEPEMVFLFLLPPLLYPAAAFASWRDFRANLSPISLLAVGLVLFTTAFVAIVAHALTA